GRRRNPGLERRPVRLAGAMGGQAPAWPTADLLRRYRAAQLFQRGVEFRQVRYRRERNLHLPDAAGVAAHRPPDHAGTTKLSMTFLVPAFSKAISSLLPSTAWTVP